MAELRELRQKIASLGNLQKVMLAMNKIATVKLRRLLPRVGALKRFDRAVSELGDELLPLVPASSPVPTSLIVVHSSDKGLCGSSNHTVLRALEELVASQVGNGRLVSVACEGLKATKVCRRLGYSVAELPDSRTLAHQLVDGTVGELWLIHNRFTSTLRQDLVRRRLVPWEPGPSTPEEWTEFPAVMEDRGEIGLALAVWLELQWEAAETHARLSEHAARMTAMDTASRNARTLGDRYHLQQNRARQAAITGDLIEVISGREALKRRRR